MAAKKAPAKKMAAPKKSGTGSANAAEKSMADKKAQRNRVTSPIPSNPKVTASDMPLSSAKYKSGGRKGLSNVANRALFETTKAFGSTVLGGASAVNKAVRKVTPLPDAKGRAVKTQPTQWKQAPSGKYVPVPKKKKK